MKLLKFIGSRVIKTGIAVFLTAWICTLLNWPPVFAVITAIVTIEPTVTDSIKKGLVRFPASAIGSAYAVLLIHFFEQTPITYALAAVLTILTCYRLNLHAGLLVATLTSVAMIEVIHSNLLIAFFIRLGTTTVGLFVSTAVNFLILPPDYRNDIYKNIAHLRKQTGEIIEILVSGLVQDKPQPKEKSFFYSVRKKLISTETLIEHQKNESFFHPLKKSEKAHFEQMQNKLDALRTIHYHINNLASTPVQTLTWSREERSMMIAAVEQLKYTLQEETHFDKEKHGEQMKILTDFFWEDNDEMTRNNEVHPTKFPPELIILYELISIYEQVENYYLSEINKSTL